MEDYSRQRHEEAGYEFVYTPHITKGTLFETSGHLDWYADGMFPPMELDGGIDYYLKPMNCPMHNLIFRARGRSYRELPLRLFEFGTVYRYEKSGVVHGLTRVRGITQDDAHIYCTREQMRDELTQPARPSCSTCCATTASTTSTSSSRPRTPEKFVGSDEVWEEATATLRRGGRPRRASSSCPTRAAPRSTARRSPCRPATRSAAPGRCRPSSSTSTCPSASSWSTPAPDGSRQRPVMIHRALFGSIERFFGGAAPSTTPARSRPGSRRCRWSASRSPTSTSTTSPRSPTRLQARGRCGSRSTTPTTGCRRRSATRSMQKVPFMLIAGDEDVAAGAVVLPLPRRPPGQRRAGRRGGRAACAEAVAARGPGVSVEAARGPMGDGRAGTAFEGFDRLWTPHRMAYIQGENKPAGDRAGCPFCAIAGRARRGGADRRTAASTAYVVLNLYPYNAGT